MPETANSDGTYTVGGFRFSAEELRRAKDVMRRAAGSVPAGPGKNTNLDHRNYAQMAVAQKAVEACRKEHLGDEQAGVPAAAMRAYSGRL